MINVLQSNLNAINGWILLDNSSRLQRQKWKRELNIETLNHIHNYWVWMLLAVFLGESIWKLRNVLCWQTSVAVLCTFKLFPVQKKNSFSFFFKTYFKRDFHYFSHFNYVPIANPSQLLDLDINIILKFLFSLSS